MAKPASLKTAIIACIGILLLSAGAYAADTAAILAQFKAGNEAFQAADYARARDSYLAAYSAGATGANLCYDLGNAYFKLDDRPRAVLWYRRALREAPRDRDILANLQRVMQTLPDTIPDVPPTWLHAAARVLVTYLSLGELSAIAALCLWTLVGLLLWHLRRKRLPGRARLIPWAVGALLILFLGLAFVRWERDYGAAHAIVVAEKTPLMSGPGSSFDKVVDAPGGLDVRIISEQGTWLQLRVPTGAIGWAQKSDVERI